MFTVTIGRNDLTRLPAAIAKAQQAVADLTREAFLVGAGHAILEDPKKGARAKCPYLWGDLRASGIHWHQGNQAWIGFGGEGRKKNPPKEYAEYIHEDPDEIKRPGPRLPINRKWVYLYLKGYPFQMGFHAMPGRYQYAERKLASLAPKVGQAHFLFGDENSALDTVLPDKLVAIQSAALAAFKMYLRA